ncbi:MAG: hypothetical protein ACNA7J_03640 [Wenzhouxiangella sp.]
MSQVHGSEHDKSADQSQGERKPKLPPILDPRDEHDEERPPLMQRMLDNPFLLLFLGVTIPTVTYIIWGVMEIVTIPISR